MKILSLGGGEGEGGKKGRRGERVREKGRKSKRTRRWGWKEEPGEREGRGDGEYRESSEGKKRGLRINQVPRVALPKS